MRKPNLEKLSYAELLELRDNVQEAMDQRRSEERKELREKLRQLVAESGFELEEVIPKRSDKRKFGKVAIKYRNPDDPTQTWTGRGRQPKWLVAELKRGRKLEDFAVG